MSSAVNGELFVAQAGYFCYLIAADIFCKKYLGARVKNEILFIVLGFASAAALNTAVQYLPDLFILFAFAEQAIFTGLIVLLFRGGTNKKLFAACSLLAALILAPAFFDSLLSALVLGLNYNAQETDAVLNTAENTGITAASYCVAVIAVILLNKNFENILSEERGGLYRAESIPLIIIIAAFDFANWGASRGIMVRSGGEAGIYLDQIYSYCGFAALAAICALGAAACVYFADKAYVEQQKNLRYNSQIDVYKTLTEQYRGTERLRHDMKNHIIALNALFRGKEWEKMGSYLENLEERGTEKAADLTGNLAVDALLCQKKKTADENKIEWECSVKIPKNITADEFDLCVILGNILDNALEACEKADLNEKRFIHIRSCAVKNSFLTEIKNSAPKKDKVELKPFRGKNLTPRGIGLSNVEETVSRLKGALHTEYADGVFTTSVLLPLTASEHNAKTDV